MENPYCSCELTRPGAPETAWVELDFKTAGTVGARLTLQNKTATRLPEAGWMSFTPAGAGAGTWSDRSASLKGVG